MPVEKGINDQGLGVYSDPVLSPEHKAPKYNERNRYSAKTDEGL